VSLEAFEAGLGKSPANYVPLSPLSFMRRTADVYPDRLALIHGDRRISWAGAYARARRLASALRAKGIGKNDTVAVMAPNTPAIFDAHFGVPMAGAVLNALNIRLDAETISFILDHGEAKVLITDREFSTVIKQALEMCSVKPLVIDIDDPAALGGEFLGEIEYEAFLETGDADFAWTLPGDEWDAISLNYTSGTTGYPKGVVYHHRGAYLLALGNVFAWDMNPHPVYLWTLPMFHCNGWCFPWTLAAMAGTSVCLRRVEAATIFGAIAEHKVTHFCGAPIVLNMLVNAKAESRKTLPHEVRVMTAAAPPPASVLQEMEEEGFHVTHVYGLTETYGPAVVCAWHPEWDELAPEERARKKSRQGIAYPMLEGLKVGDERSLEPVPKDGETLGEVFFQGNIVMKGYLKNPEATREAFAGGWFHSGDLGVCHPDNYIDLKDRSKDIIISGGENISTIEVEAVLYRHGAVLEAAVVAKEDTHWGEVPCAFVALKDGQSVGEGELIAFCRSNLAHYKCPKHVVFGALPKTSTGKVQKFVLRERTKQI
jgi:fatty-acyl-CoA synthase